MPASNSNSSEGDPESPLPTPSHDTESLFASLQSFSFGASVCSASALTSSSADSPSPPLGTSGRPLKPLSLSSFPAYCFPSSSGSGSSRRRSSARPDLEDLEETDVAGGSRAFSFGRAGVRRVDREEDDQDGVNPSPVYGEINEDGFTIQPLGTPIAERERFEYPEFPANAAAGSSSNTSSYANHQTAVPSRPEVQPDQTRRGSISLPNVLTTSGILAPPFSPPSCASSIPDARQSPPLLHPANSPFYSPRQSFSLKSVPSRRNSSRNNSLALPSPSSSGPSSGSPDLARTAPSPNRQSISRSTSVSGRPQLPTSHVSFGGRPNSGSMSHIHPPYPPFSRFQPTVTSAPIPPSLRSHPALSSSTSSTSPSAANFKRPSPTLPQTKSSFTRRRDSLPTISPPLLDPVSSTILAKRVSEGGAGAFAGALGRRRGSEAGVGLGIRRMVKDGGEEEGRPKLGSIPSFGSDETETPTPPAV